MRYLLQIYNNLLETLLENLSTLDGATFRRLLGLLLLKILTFVYLEQKDYFI